MNELQKLQEMQMDLYVQYKGGLLTLAQYREKMKPLDRKIEELEMSSLLGNYPRKRASSPHTPKR